MRFFQLKNGQYFWYRGILFQKNESSTEYGFYYMNAINFITGEVAYFSGGDYVGYASPEDVIIEKAKAL